LVSIRGHKAEDHNWSITAVKTSNFIEKPIKPHLYFWIFIGVEFGNPIVEGDRMAE
jgi:hypothetical protein